MDAMTIDVNTLMNSIGRNARAAAHEVALASTATKRSAIRAAANFIDAATNRILDANLRDLDRGEANGLSRAMLDRLRLDPSRISGISNGLNAISELDDPVGHTIAEWTQPNGLQIERVRTPLGVIGVIYESRPNVTADAGALCLMSGNAVILRGGSDSFYSSSAIYNCLKKGLQTAGIPDAVIQLVPTTDRAAVGCLLRGLEGNVDVVVPRGGKNLVARVQAESRVPVFSHLEGICHVYVDAAADPDMAVRIVENAKLRRTGICGAAETLLIARPVAASLLPVIVEVLQNGGCEIRGDEETCNLIPHATPATDDDWETEYLDAVLSVRIVAGVEEAITHIGKYSSNHTESIVTSDDSAAELFLRKVDSAIVLHNASTQFADGGEFGMGAEIGIATGRMHARGPIGVEQLTTFKYCVRGNGQTRP